MNVFSDSNEIWHTFRMKLDLSSCQKSGHSNGWFMRYNHQNMKTRCTCLCITCNFIFSKVWTFSLIQMKFGTVSEWNYTCLPAKNQGILTVHSWGFTIKSWRPGSPVFELHAISYGVKCEHFLWFKWNLAHFQNEIRLVLLPKIRYF